MLINNVNANVDTNISDTDITNFSITQDTQGNAIIMDILRSRLYTNPLKACLREIITNAIDANIEAGRADTPISLTLPTATNPSITISDSGPGMSPTLISNVYTKFGGSTKRNTNDLHGAFGIGSKSISAVAEQADITTVWEGIEYKYIFYVSESGLLKLAKVSDYPTTKPSGTSISIPLKPEQQGKLNQIIPDTIKWINPLPIIRNNLTMIEVINTSLASYEKYTTDEGIDFYYRPPSGYEYTYNSILNSVSSYNLTVILGVMPYTTSISTNMLSDTAKAGVLRQCATDIYCSNKADLVITASIGSLDITASRENLQYTDRTLNQLEYLVQQCFYKLKDEVDEKIQKADTLKEIVSCLQRYGVLVHSSYVSSIEYKGRQFDLTKLLLTVPQSIKIVNLKFSDTNDVKERETIRNLSIVNIERRTVLAPPRTRISDILNSFNIDPSQTNGIFLVTPQTPYDFNSYTATVKFLDDIGLEYYNYYELLKTNKPTRYYQLVGIKDKDSTNNNNDSNALSYKGRVYRASEVLNHPDNLTISANVERLYFDRLTIKNCKYLTTLPSKGVYISRYSTNIITDQFWVCHSYAVEQGLDIYFLSATFFDVASNLKDWVSYDSLYKQLTTKFVCDYGFPYVSLYYMLNRVLNLSSPTPSVTKNTLLEIAKSARPACNLLVDFLSLSHEDYLNLSLTYNYYGTYRERYLHSYTTFLQSYPPTSNSKVNSNKYLDVIKPLIEGVYQCSPYSILSILVECLIDPDYKYPLLHLISDVYNRTDIDRQSLLDYINMINNPNCQP